MSDFKTLALSTRRRILELGLNAGKNGSHQGSGMSIVDILSVLYGGALNIDKENLNKPERDRFILSKGHAAVALYAVLEKKGFLTNEETSTFENNGTSYYAHAHRDLTRGIEFSGGSLSLGLSYGVGVALSCKRAHLSNRIVVLVGDGECDEGLVWESAMAAGNFLLSNLSIIVDCNGMQSDGKKSEIMNHFSIADKFRAFGFEVVEIDGHQHAAISAALRLRHESKPMAIIANTVKGKGISFMEGNADWHHGILTQSLFDTAMTELGGIV
ncbi:MAG: Transketolase central region [uncultured bacterium]|nr:MAG: Transketolase central region [uncultured bacterium]